LEWQYVSKIHKTCNSLSQHWLVVKFWIKRLNLIKNSGISNFHNLWLNRNLTLFRNKAGVLITDNYLGNYSKVWPRGGARCEFILQLKTESDIIISSVAPPCVYQRPLVQNTVSRKPMIAHFLAYSNYLNITSGTGSFNLPAYFK
jgi:hypothetical protein